VLREFLPINIPIALFRSLSNLTAKPAYIKGIELHYRTRYFKEYLFTARGQNIWQAGLSRQSQAPDCPIMIGGVSDGDCP
jgi:hypothetical protein